MTGRIPIAFLAGFASFVAPCVLPLVPGYLSTVSSLNARELGGRGAARRVLATSLPFVAGFTLVFVALGVAISALAGAVDQRVFEEIAGFVLVVFGLGFAHLLPLPERPIAPGLLTAARDRGSRVLLGAAFATCAAPCVSPILASTLVLAADTSTVAQGATLLFAYSLGLAIPFVVTGLVFAPAMGSFRWLRDRYRYFEVVGGVILVALGLLLFFDRMWWLRSGFSHVFG
jgi:cytochrome c-type biogenesis protein